MKTHLITLLIGTILISSCEEAPEKAKDLNYQVITSDLENFWIAYDALENSTDSVQTFQELYIDKASPEFEKFIELRKFKAQEYVECIKGAPNFWKSVRPITLAVKDKKDDFDKIYRKMEEIYGEFQPPNICFAISPIRTGGTTTKGLILIGTEISTASAKSTDISEINGFFKTYFENSKGDITSMIAHELIHTQQSGGDNEDATLLSQSIVEGSADFLGSLILGDLTMNKAVFNYGEKHEKSLWNEFKNDVNNNKGFDDTDWFYDYNSDRPADLGYYLGYKITESYYNNSSDKKLAIEEILEMTNAENFLSRSRYGE